MRARVILPWFSSSKEISRISPRGIIAGFVIRDYGYLLALCDEKSSEKNHKDDVEFEGAVLMRRYLCDYVPAAGLK
jgi:hypothetical protein